MKQTRYALLYWLSPIIGIIIPSVIFYAALDYWSAPQHAVAEPVVYLSSGIIYAMIAVIGIVSAYIYLLILNGFARYYTALTIVSVLAVGIINFYIGSKLLAGKTPSVTSSEIWMYCTGVILFCIPVYWTAHLYVGKNR